MKNAQHARPTSKTNLIIQFNRVVGTFRVGVVRDEGKRVSSSLRWYGEKV